jgi:uncharacterized protein YbjT (DUF2867 family)
MVHNPARASQALRAGATEIAHADLHDRDSLTAALDRMDGVFHITPAFAPDASELGRRMVDAATRAGVQKSVYSGVYHPSLSLVNHASTRPIEEALYDSDLRFTILQPAMSMQGLAGPCRDAIRSGKMVMPWSKLSKMTYVDYRDVAEAAATAMTGEDLNYGTFELAAPGMADRTDIAGLLSAASGRAVTAADPEGRPGPEQPGGLAAMFESYDRHGFHGGNDLLLRTVLDRGRRTLPDYITELARPVADHA